MRVRFAPSPTGALHLGNVRTALFSWLAARATKGQFILRIEDTDQERYVEGGDLTVFDTLRWLGLAWDEGPEVGGPHAPYVQSQRKGLYQEYGTKLVASGHAYWCTCTPDRLEAMRLEQQRRGQPTRYDRHCLSRQDEIQTHRDSGGAAVLRLRMPEGISAWNDVVRGKIEFNNGEIDDSVLLKSDGFPTYHLAVVVDDHLMEITHVIRSEEWIPSTPKHLALYQAFGWEPPAFAHVPIVLGPDKKKLSKRHGAKRLLDYRTEGYLPSALINAMALLGWSPPGDEDILGVEDIVKFFDIHDVHASPAVFDPQRLDSINAHHIRLLSREELGRTLGSWLDRDPATLLPLVPLVQERITTLADASTLLAPIFSTEVNWGDDVAFPPKNVTTEQALTLLEACLAEVESNGTSDPTGIRTRLTDTVTSMGLKPRDAFRVIYCALFGQPTGIPVFDAMEVLGKEITTKRLSAARERLIPASKHV